MSCPAVGAGDDAAAAADDVRARLRALMSEKTSLESRIAAAGAVLAQQNVHMDDPLVDAEDYPRADIDVYAVRHARSELRRLQNDYRELMRRIEASLTELHAQARGTPATEGDGEVAEPPPAAFLQVTTVTAGSPAESAGLQPGDQLASLGSVNASNFSGLADVAAAVQHSSGRALRVEVLRQGRRTPLLLTPRPWAGRGLLGCTLVPLDSPER